ncbi:hypothetical protein B9Z55_010951 [Caenorhabditis nigoni]|uniref:Uncharacterized protein n=1 Tax=Caenorhabditis nigoni TaxID=1611254 RepID=A0A2G5UI06_9PELO|nr:hypothetical protein B9Z55_010951 [Caenorhabditis nigoni]
MPSFNESQHQLEEDKKEKVTRCHQYLRQDESSPVGQKLQRCRRTQDTNQDDSSSSRSPEDVPSKSDGPMDITVTTRSGNGISAKVGSPSQRRSVRMRSPRGGDQANDRDNSVTSSAKPIVNSRCQDNSSQTNCYHEAKY